MRLACASGFRCIALAVLLAGPARTDTLEPPPESPADTDYSIERADSLAEGSLEVTVGAAGNGGAPSRSRRVRFSGDSLVGSLREGDGDPLAGGLLEGSSSGGAFGMGKLAPRWGRGLLLGAPAEPWSISADDRGRGAAFRGRSGEGAYFRREGTLGGEALFGRFGKRRLGGVALRSGPLAVAGVGAGAGEVQYSLAFERGRFGSEWAVDRAGRWRAEAALGRALGSSTLAMRVRGGHPGFRSLAEPTRAGPAQALSTALSVPREAADVRLVGALWRFGPGLAGARGAIEVARRGTAYGDLAAGFEEQRGVRRPPAGGGTAGVAAVRQGFWGDWRGGREWLSLGMHHEIWAARSRMRQPVRVVTSARADAVLFSALRLRVTHTVFQARRGESLYLPESEGDRLVLRALSGTGERTRIELRVPLATGSVQGSVNLLGGAARPRPPQWNLAWTRRARFRRSSRS